MFGGSVSQPLHIITASIWLQTVSMYMFILSGGHWGNTLKTHICHHHDVYCHASIGSAAPSCCVNYTQLLGSVWTNNGGELANCHCGVSVWKGLLTGILNGQTIVTDYALNSPDYLWVGQCSCIKLLAIWSVSVCTCIKRVVLWLLFALKTQVKEKRFFIFVIYTVFIFYFWYVERR